MKFKQLPAVVKIAVMLTFFNTWVLFEELVIDRLGYWQYLPFYKKGIFCVWDVMFLLTASFFVFNFWDKISSKCFLQKCIICNNRMA